MHGFRLKSPCVTLFSLCALIAAISRAVLAAEPATQRLLYVAAPGIRNDLQFGGAGILVFNIDGNHTFVKRIETTASRQPKPENIKGVCASAATGRLYFTTLTRLYCLDLATEKELWNKATSRRLRSAFDHAGWQAAVRAVARRPALERRGWPNRQRRHEDRNEERLAQHRRQHRRHANLLRGLKSPLLTVVDTAKNEIVGTVGPFSAEIRPFTINGDKTRCYVTVNRLLGFEIGDLTTGKFLERVEVKGGGVGTPTRHGTPSHGVGMTPDEREIWVCDSVGRAVHIFDMTGAHPRQVDSVALREEPGWITSSVDGHFAYPSTGDVIDTANRKVVTQLQDEKGRPVESEKLLEIDFRDGKVSRTGDQFGIGRAAKP